MPQDRSGKTLNPGDRVTLEAEVTHVHGKDDNAQVTIRSTASPNYYATLSSKLLESVAVAATGAPAVALLLMFFALCFSAPAQTAATGTNAPDSALFGNTGSTLWDFATTGSNYWAAPYGTFGVSSHTAGGGIAVGYHISDVVNPVLRLDYFDGSFWMPSLTAQLQPPRQLMGKIPVIPFGIAGMATPIAGAGTGNGSLVTILGAGAALKLDAFGSASWLKHTDLVVDYEKWLGLPQKEQNQVRFGVLIKF